MPQKSGFFDTTADDPREYPSREFAEYFARFVGNGVFGGGEKLKVSASGKDMNVSINLGYGWINGYMYSVFDTPLVLPIQQATTQDRIDRIILRLDVSTPVRAIRAIVLQGNPGTTPQVPSIVRTGDIYDLSLAQVIIKANTSTIQSHQITDERLNTQVCGIVTGLIQQADTTSIFNEFQSWLKTKTAEYQKQWQDIIDQITTIGLTAEQIPIKDKDNHFEATNVEGALNELFTNVVDGKNKLKTAIIVKGGTVQGTAPHSFTELDNGIRSIPVGPDTNDATAVASDILVNKTAYVRSAKISGAMPNRSAENQHMPSSEQTAWPGDRVFLKPPHGYYDGASFVTAPTPYLKPENIRAGTNILGVVGALVAGRPFANGRTGEVSTVVVSGLNFRPVMVVCRNEQGDIALYAVASMLGDFEINYEARPAESTQYNIFTITADGFRCTNRREGRGTYWAAIG